MAEVTTTDEAINAVLRAERDARAAVEACGEEAEQVLAEARQEARRIARRTESRISRLHNRCAADMHRRVEAMLRPERSPANSIPATSEDEILQAAVDLLADELIGEGKPG